MNSSKILVDIGYLYVIPIISTIGLVSNLVCILTLVSDTNVIKAHISYKYLIVNSLIDAIYLMVVAFLPIARCNYLCNLSKYYISKVYELYGFLFASNVLNTFSAYMSILISIDRYLFITKNIILQRKLNTCLVLVIIACLSVLHHIPQIVSLKVDYIHQQILNNSSSNSTYQVYTLTNTIFGSTKFSKILIMIMQILINTIPLFVIFLINILLLIKLHRQLLLGKNLYNTNELYKLEVRKIKTDYYEPRNGIVFKTCTNFPFVSLSVVPVLKRASLLSKWQIKLLSIKNLAHLGHDERSINDSSTQIKPNTDLTSPHVHDSQNRKFQKSRKYAKIERNATLMVVLMSFIYILGRAANMTSVCTFLFDMSSTKTDLKLLICNIIEFLTYSINLFVYCIFNKNFARTLLRHYYGLIRCLGKIK